MSSVRQVIHETPAEVQDSLAEIEADYNDPVARATLAGDVYMEITQREVVPESKELVDALSAADEALTTISRYATVIESMIASTHPKGEKRMIERCATIRSDSVVWRGKINTARDRVSGGISGVEKSIENLTHINDMVKSEIVRAYSSSPAANLGIISMFSATIPNLTPQTKKRRTG